MGAELRAEFGGHLCLESRYQGRRRADVLLDILSTGTRRGHDVFRNRGHAQCFWGWSGAVRFHNFIIPDDDSPGQAGLMRGLSPENFPCARAAVESEAPFRLCVARQLLIITHALVP